MLDAYFTFQEEVGRHQVVELVAAYAHLCRQAPSAVSMYCFVTATRVQILAGEVVTHAQQQYPADSEEQTHSTLSPADLFDALQKLGPASCRRFTQSLAKLNRSFDSGNRHGHHYRWYVASVLCGYGIGWG
jgi:hypothetical protein